MKVICVKGCTLVDAAGKPKACGHRLSVRFQLNGKDVKRGLKTTNLREAEKRAPLERQKAEDEAWQRENHPERTNNPEPVPIPSFRAFVELPDEDRNFEGGMWWWKHASIYYKLRPKTVGFYSSRIKSLLRFAPLANAHLDQIDRNLIDEFIAARVQTHSNNTVNQDVKVLHFILRKARPWKLITTLPEFPQRAEQLPVPNVGRAINAEEEKIYFAALARLGYRDLSDLARLAIETSIEPGPVVVSLLDWSHVRFENLGEGYEYGKIHDPFTKRPTRQRNLPMSMLLAKTLHERWLWLGRPMNGLVFAHATRRGHPACYNTFLGQHSRLWKRGWIQIPYFRLYDLRHTFLTRVDEAGGDRSDVQAWAGWASPHATVAGKYLHENKERLGRARLLVEAHVEKLRRA